VAVFVDQGGSGPKWIGRMHFLCSVKKLNVDRGHPDAPSRNRCPEAYSGHRKVNRAILLKIRLKLQASKIAPAYQRMASGDDIVLLACVMAVAAAASTIKDELLDDDAPELRPQLRFVRPETSYLDYLDMQRDLLHDRGDRVIYDTFQMNGASLDALVKMATPYLRGRVNPRDVVCVVVHWLATGVSVRAQEQFFLDKGFSTLKVRSTCIIIYSLRLTADPGHSLLDPIVFGLQMGGESVDASRMYIRLDRDPGIVHPGCRSTFYTEHGLRVACNNNIWWVASVIKFVQKYAQTYDIRGAFAPKLAGARIYAHLHPSR